MPALKRHFVIMTQASSHQRLHDLDALRAAAMLIGIVYHAALSFAADFPWMVQDVSQAQWAYIFQAWVHGFRMQLFMLVSGFFTAMLWRKRGLAALLWHRCRRVLFPCLAGLVTVVPAMMWSVDFAMRHAAEEKQEVSQAGPVAEEAGGQDFWRAIQVGSLEVIEDFLNEGQSVTDGHPIFRTPPLQWAALNGQEGAVVLLLERGAPIDGRGGDGHSALHGAAFMGYPDIVRLLLKRGADVNAASNNGETPLHNGRLDFGVVQYISGILGLKVDQAAWAEGRKSVEEQLVAAGGVVADEPASSLRDVLNFLLYQPVFILIWFLWFLVWLVAIFALYAVVAGRFGWRFRPGAWLLSPLNLVWLVPLTCVPTAMMGTGTGIGPDTSMGIVPMPHVLVYYALFFFFGVAYFDCDDRENRLGASWRWMLPLTLLVVFPLALEFATGMFGFGARLMPEASHRMASVLFQSMFAWMMAFSCIGMFRALLRRENHAIRYISDSSYWLYLAHLPLCIAAQAVIRQWNLPAWIKLSLLTIVLTGFLLLTYHWLVRYTWIGTFLNGPRVRRVKT